MDKRPSPKSLLQLSIYYLFIYLFFLGGGLMAVLTLIPELYMYMYVSALTALTF